MADPSWLYSNDKVAKYGTEATSLVLRSCVLTPTYGGPNTYIHGLTSDPTLDLLSTSIMSGTSTDLVSNTACTLATPAGSTGTIDVIMTEIDSTLQPITIPAGSTVFTNVNMYFYSNEINQVWTANARLSYVSPGGTITDIMPMTTSNPLSYAATGTGANTYYPQVNIPFQVPSAITVPAGSRFRLEVKATMSTNASGTGQIAVFVGDTTVNGGHDGCWVRIPIQPGL